MLKTKRKNLKNVKKIFKNELKNRIKNLIFTKFFSSTYSKENEKTFPKLIIKTQKTKTLLKSICNVNSTTKSVNSNYYIGRSSFRELLSFGIIPGFRKSVW